MVVKPPILRIADVSIINRKNVYRESRWPVKAKITNDSDNRRWGQS
jgi:hypothetical protein